MYWSLLNPFTHSIEKVAFRTLAKGFDSSELGVFFDLSKNERRSPSSGAFAMAELSQELLKGLEVLTDAKQIPDVAFKEITEIAFAVLLNKVTEQRMQGNFVVVRGSFSLLFQIMVEIHSWLDLWAIRIIIIILLLFPRFRNHLSPLISTPTSRLRYYTSLTRPLLLFTLFCKYIHSR